MQRKLNLQVQHYNKVLFKKSVIKIGLTQYNKVPDQIKLSGNFN
jgi:hypothetical protein